MNRSWVADRLRRSSVRCRARRNSRCGAIPSARTCWSRPCSASTSRPIRASCTRPGCGWARAVARCAVSEPGAGARVRRDRDRRSGTASLRNSARTYLHSTRRAVPAGVRRRVRGGAQPRDRTSAAARGSEPAAPRRPGRARRRRAVDRRHRTEHHRRTAPHPPARAVRHRRARGRPRSRRIASAPPKAAASLGAADRCGRARVRDGELADGVRRARGRVVGGEESPAVSARIARRGRRARRGVAAGRSRGRPARLRAARRPGRARAAQRARAARIVPCGARVLVLGTEELMYAPLLVAVALAATGCRTCASRRRPARRSSSWTSPAIRSAARLHFDADGPRFAYNVASGLHRHRPGRGRPVGARRPRAGAARAVRPGARRGVADASAAPAARCAARHSARTRRTRSAGCSPTCPASSSRRRPRSARRPIQSGGAHYAESLPIEYQPTAEYQAAVRGRARRIGRADRARGRRGDRAGARPARP